jgi:hypothetical protein
MSMGVFILLTAQAAQVKRFYIIQFWLTSVLKEKSLSPWLRPE